MCWCDPSIASQFCGAADCHPPVDADILGLLNDVSPQAPDLPPGNACQHLSISVDKKLEHMADTGRSMLHIRVTCADCKTPFMFQGLPQGLDLKGATTDLTGRVGHFAMLAEGAIPRDTGNPTKFTPKGS